MLNNFFKLLKLAAIISNLITQKNYLDYKFEEYCKRHSIIRYYKSYSDKKRKIPVEVMHRKTCVA